MRAAFPLIIAGLSMLGPFTVDTIFPGFAAIQRDFGVGPEATQQLVSAYLLAFAAMSAFHGPLSDALGRRPVIMGGLGLYAVASVGAALSTSMSMLIGFRILQGLCAGASVIVSRTLVVDLYSGAEAQRLMSRVTMIFGVAPAIAPIVGGWLMWLGPWPLMFWFLAGFALLLIGASLILPETHPPSRRTPLRVGALVHGLVTVLCEPAFLRLGMVGAFGFAAFFTWIGAAAIFVVDLLGLGETDFWVLFVPMIGAIIGGSWLNGRTAGSTQRDTLITRSLSFAVAMGVLNLGLTLWGPTARLPYVVIGPALIALGVMVVYPTIQIMLLEMYPTQRGAASSVATVLALVLNAVVAGAVAPLITRSLWLMATCGLLMATLALATWVAHRRLSDSVS